MHEFLLFMAAPFAACLVLVGIHVYLGIHILERGVIFADLALAQIAALGRMLAVVAGYDLDSRAAYLLSLGMAFAGAALLSLTRPRRMKVPQEALIGIFYVVAAAASILVVDRAPHGAEHLEDLLVGSILWVSWNEVFRTALLYAVVGAFHWIFRRRFILISLGEEKSLERGCSRRLWDFIFYALFALVISVSVKIAGVLLVFSFLIVPGVCAALFGGGIGRRLGIGWAVGFAVSVLGCSLSYVEDLPTGATVVCTFGLALALLALVRAGGST